MKRTFDVPGTWDLTLPDCFRLLECQYRCESWRGSGELCWLTRRPPADWSPAKGSLCMAAGMQHGAAHNADNPLQHNAHGLYFHPTTTADKSTPTNGLYFVCLRYVKWFPCFLRGYQINIPSKYSTYLIFCSLFDTTKKAFMYFVESLQH